MNNNKSQKQVSLSGMAMNPKNAKGGKGGKPSTGGNKKRRLIALAVAGGVLLCVLLGVFILDGPDGPSLEAREFVEFTYTPDNTLKNVSYYALGIMGENTTSSLDMMAIMCFNRKEHTISLLQVPVATYVEDDRFAVQKAGDIWGSPKALTWCPTCRCHVAADALEGEKHTACGSTVESRSGSAATGFAQYFNTQLGLPVDNYLVIPRGGLATLIDALGGVTLHIAKNFRYNEVDYSAGEGTLPGDAAVYYVTQWEYNGSPASDLERMQRQRELMAALMFRLSERKASELYNTDPAKKDVLSNLMAGRSPIRMDTSNFGKARLLGKANDDAAADVRYTEALADFLHTLSRVSLEDVTCSMLPGESTKKGAATVYSAHRNVTLELLHAQMDPASLLDDTAVALKEIAGNGKSDARTVTLDTLLTPQASLEEKSEK